MATYEQNKRWRLANTEKTREQRSRHNTRRRAIIEKYRGTLCKDCGGEFPAYVLEFDHCRGEKLYNIASMGVRSVSESVLRAELEKCDVVCANCHRTRDYNR